MIFVEIGVSLVGNCTYVPYTSGDVRILIRRWIHLPDLSDVNILVVAVMPPRYELEKYKKLIRACDCRTTLLVRRQVTHTYKSQWSDPELISFIQGSEESGHTVCKGKKARRTSWILRATTLGFIYTLDVLLSKLSRSVSSK